MAHKIEKVVGRFLPQKLYANTEYVFKFTVKDKDGNKIDLTGDSLTFKAHDRIADSQLWSKSCTITSASDGKCEATVTSSDNNTATEAVFELSHDIDNDGDVDGRIQWFQELHETV